MRVVSISSHLDARTSGHRRNGVPRLGLRRIELPALFAQPCGPTRTSYLEPEEIGRSPPLEEAPSGRSKTQVSPTTSPSPGRTRRSLGFAGGGPDSVADWRSGSEGEHTREMQLRGTVRCLLAAVLFGASAPAASKLAGEMPALVLAGLLYLGAGLAVLPSVAHRRPTAAAVRREWRPVTVAVIAGGAVGPALLIAGLARTSAASASIMLNLELAATVALAATVFREHLGRRVVGGAAIVTLAGVLLVFEPGAEASVGALLIAAACVAWGFDNGVTATIDQLTPQHVVFLKGAVAGAANLVLGLSTAAEAQLPTPGQVAIAMLIGSLGYGLSIVLWVKGAHDLGAARGQVIFSTAPFIGAAIAWTVLSESISAIQIGAMGLAALGVAITIESAHEHGHAHEGLEHEHDHDHDHHADDHHDPVPAGQRHTHRHRHQSVTHGHPHVPDLHHRHRHD